MLGEQLQQLEPGEVEVVPQPAGDEHDVDPLPGAPSVIVTVAIASEVDALHEPAVDGEVGAVDVLGARARRGRRRRWRRPATSPIGPSGWVFSVASKNSGRRVLDPVPVAALDPDRAGRHDVAADALGAEHLRLAERPVRDRRLERAVAVRAAGEVLADGRRADADQRRRRRSPPAPPTRRRRRGRAPSGRCPCCSASPRTSCSACRSCCGRRCRARRAARWRRRRSRAATSLSAASTAPPHTVPRCAQLGDGLLDALGVAGADRDGRALVEQRLGDRPTDALGRAGDDGPLAGESEIHGTAPLTSVAPGVTSVALQKAVVETGPPDGGAGDRPRDDGDDER